jgi:hypothetical protein
LTYTAGSHGSISGTSPQTVNYGGNGTAVTAVPDAGYHFVEWSDGLSDAQEGIAGTDAMKEWECFRVETTTASAGETASLTWPSVAGRVYTVYVAERLGGPWTGAVEVVGDGTTQTYDASVPAGGKVYLKLGVQLQQ